MKKFLIISLSVLAAVFSLSSCQSKGGEEEQPKYYSSNYELGIESLEFKLYDFTVTYYDVRLEEVNSYVMTGQLWNYNSATAEPNFDKFVLKVEGKLKPNAADIVKDLVAAGKSLESGYFYTFKAGYYKDDKMKNLITSLVDDSNEIYATVEPKDFESFLSQPTISIIDVVK